MKKTYTKDSRETPIIEMVVTQEGNFINVNIPLTGEVAIAATRDMLTSIKDFLKYHGNLAATQANAEPFSDEEVYDALIDLVYANRSHTPLENTLQELNYGQKLQRQHK
jgi:hypothetical protein